MTEPPPSRAADPATLPAQDSVCRAAEALCAPNALLERMRDAWAQEGCPSTCSGARLLQMHYRPFTRARIVAELSGIDATRSNRPFRQYLFIQIYPSREKARSRFASTSAKHALVCVGPPALLLDDLNAIAWSLPNGPCLRTAKVGFRPRKFRKMLRKVADKIGRPREIVPKRPPAPELIRYVPRRRAVFHHRPSDGLDLPPAFIKIFASGDYEPARRNHVMISEAGTAGALSFLAPRILATSSRRRCLVLAEISGEPFTSKMAACRPSDFEAVGRGLASLHRSDLAPAATWTTDLELTRLRAAAAELALALPGFARSIESLVDRLAKRRGELEWSDRVPIHGNMFGDQVLLDGEDVGIVDWDDLCDGDPMFDVGRMLAHFFLVARREHVAAESIARATCELLDEYRAGTGRPIPRSRLVWQTAVALVMRAKISALRMLPANWHADVATCVAEAGRLLDGQNAWLDASLDE